MWRRRRRLRWAGPRHWWRGLCRQLGRGVWRACWLGFWRGRLRGTWADHVVITVGNARVTITSDTRLLIITEALHCFVQKEVVLLASKEQQQPPRYELNNSNTVITVAAVAMWVNYYVGKPSTTGQPTRPTQPFIVPGSINEQKACLSDVCLVAPSGECLRGY